MVVLVDGRGVGCDDNAHIPPRQAAAIAGLRDHLVYNIFPRVRWRVALGRHPPHSEYSLLATVGKPDNHEHRPPLVAPFTRASDFNRSTTCRPETPGLLPDQGHDQGPGGTFETHWHEKTRTLDSHRANFCGHFRCGMCNFPDNRSRITRSQSCINPSRGVPHTPPGSSLNRCHECLQ